MNRLSPESQILKKFWPPHSTIPFQLHVCLIQKSGKSEIHIQLNICFNNPNTLEIDDEIKSLTNRLRIIVRTGDEEMSQHLPVNQILVKLSQPWIAYLKQWSSPHQKSSNKLRREKKEEKKEEEERRDFHLMISKFITIIFGKFSEKTWRQYGKSFNFSQLIHSKIKPDASHHLPVIRNLTVFQFL